MRSIVAQRVCCRTCRTKTGAVLPMSDAAYTIIKWHSLQISEYEVTPVCLIMHNPGCLQKFCPFVKRQHLEGS